MVPDYISEKKMRELKLSKGETEGNGDCYTCMGCRSFLTPDRYGQRLRQRGQRRQLRAGQAQVLRPLQPGRRHHQPARRGAVLAAATWTKFWEIFDERLELCHKALMCRHERLKGTLSDAAPILWQYGALARLKKGEPIDKLLYGGYSTICSGLRRPVRVREVHDRPQPHRPRGARRSPWRSCST